LVALAPDGKTLAATRDGTVILWDVATGKELRRLRGPFFGGNDLAFTADGKALQLSGIDGAVLRWDVATGKQTAGPEQGPLPGGMVTIRGGGAALSPDGKLLARQHIEPQNAAFSIKVIDVASGKELAEVNTGPGGGIGLTFSPDGKTLAW